MFIVALRWLVSVLACGVAFAAVDLDREIVLTPAAGDMPVDLEIQRWQVRGHVLHNLHHFLEAERLARSLVDERGSPRDWALLGDALMEQGKLPEAITAIQRLVELKPGTEAYSRIAQVRWLTGDLSGATAA